MFARLCSLSLALPFLLRAVGAIDIKVGDSGTIKDATKLLASSIVTAYNDQLTGSPIGVFPDPYYWWESGAAWGGLIEYSHLTGDTQFDNTVATALWAQRGDWNAFMPPNQTKTLGNSDQSVWGIAALTAAEVGFTKPEEGEWINLAENVWNTLAVRWDNATCDGGLRWQIFSFNNGYEYKDSVSNGNFFLLSARLAQFTGNKTYEEWADKSFKWMQDLGLISGGYAVYDGADTNSCDKVNKIQWSYPFGVMTEGAAVMYNLTNGNSTWKSAVSGFLGHLPIFQDNSTRILFESACEKSNKCNIDQQAYKGLAARSLARAAISAPFAAESVSDALEQSAIGALRGCDEGIKGKPLMCGPQWYIKTLSSDAETVSEGGLGAILGALEVTQALLYPEAKADGNATTPTNTANPAASGTATPSGSSSAADASGTSAAGTMKVTWGGVVFAGLLAVLV